MNVEHSDIRACTQGVYSCLVKRLLRDYRQQHPQTSDTAIIRCIYICGNITEDYDQVHGKYPRVAILIPRESRACAKILGLPHKKWPGNDSMHDKRRAPPCTLRMDATCTCVILSERGIYGSLLRKRRRLEYLVAYLCFR